MLGEPSMSEREELLREYYMIHERIAQYDDRQISIKSWATTAVAALLGLAYSEAGEPEFLLIAALAALIFWYIDAQWKSFQLIAILHARALERVLERGGPYPAGPTIATHFDKSFAPVKKFKRFWSRVVLASVWLPHLPLGLTALGLYLWGKGLRLPELSLQLG